MISYHSVSKVGHSINKPAIMKPAMANDKATKKPLNTSKIDKQRPTISQNFTVIINSILYFPKSVFTELNALIISFGKSMTLELSELDS